MATRQHGYAAHGIETNRSGTIQARTDTRGTAGLWGGLGARCGLGSGRARRALGATGLATAIPGDENGRAGHLDTGGDPNRAVREEHSFGERGGKVGERAEDAAYRMIRRSAVVSPVPARAVGGQAQGIGGRRRKRHALGGEPGEHDLQQERIGYRDAQCTPSQAPPLSLASHRRSTSRVSMCSYSKTTFGARMQKSSTADDVGGEPHRSSGPGLAPPPRRSYPRARYDTWAGCRYSSTSRDDHMAHKDKPPKTANPPPASSVRR